MKYQVISNSFSELIYNIQDYFNKNQNKVIFDNRNILKITEYKNTKYVIKSFKIPHLLNQVVYRFFRDSKAKRSYINSIKLLELGINTPQPIGFAEFEGLVLFKKSYYVSEFFDYDFEIREVFTNKEFNNRKHILKEFVKFTFDLHQKGVYHIDYSPGNVIIKQQNDNLEFSIIDVNRMKFTKFDLDMRMKNFSKLTFNEDDNNYMIKIYSTLIDIDFEVLKEKLDFYLNEQKRYLENKKRLKKIKGKKDIDEDLETK